MHATVNLGVEVRWGVDPSAKQIEIANQRIPDHLASGVTVFPGQTKTLRYDIGVGNDAIDEVGRWSQETFGHHEETISPAIVGSVDYRTVLGPQRYETGFIYKIVRRVPIVFNGESDVGISRSRGNVPLNHLQFGNWIHDGRTF